MTKRIILEKVDGVILKTEVEEEKPAWDPDMCHLPDIVKAQLDKFLDHAGMRRRTAITHVALMQFARWGTATEKTVVLNLDDGYGGTYQKEHTFYKLDCPEPNKRLDGSEWPRPYGSRPKGQRL